ncbi:MAG: hypothetical protein FWD17_05960, partial [Polyangiaceae bacterium]|nr:hypothetical protein [Polyangiaceae bacterium]
MRAWFWGLVVGIASALGCGSDHHGGPVPDGGAEAGSPDGAAPDGAAPEGAAPDASPDGMSDAESADEESADAADAMAEGGDADAQSCSWSRYDDGLVGAAINTVAFDARGTSSIVYATAANVLYASTDHGQTWTQRGEFGDGSIASLAMPGTDPSLLLATSSAGVIRSTDSGQTWSALSLSGEDVTAIGASPASANRLYASVYGGGVFRSDDAGMTWAAKNLGYPIALTVSLNVAPDNPDEVVSGAVLLADGGSSSGSAILRTTDGGQTWTSAATMSYLTSVRRCPSDPTVLYAGTQNGLQRSGDRGATWQVTAGTTSEVIDVGISSADCNSIVAFVLND